MFESKLLLNIVSRFLSFNIASSRLKILMPSLIGSALCKPQISSMNLSFFSSSNRKFKFIVSLLTFL